MVVFLSVPAFNKVRTSTAILSVNMWLSELVGAATTVAATAA